MVESLGFVIAEVSHGWERLGEFAIHFGGSGHDRILQARLQDS